VVKLWATVNYYSKSTSTTNLKSLFLVMGKAEGIGENWHGHVTALTVSPDFRRLGLAATLMNFLEDVSEKYKNILENVSYYNFVLQETRLLC
jgi:ribosomal protein S18 acetylase RimI-like enzyme